MRYKTVGKTLFIYDISNDTLNLSKTLDCGQCFRWKERPDGTIQGVVGDRVYLFKRVEFEGISYIATTATQQEWEDTFIEYFDLNTDYSKLIVPKDDTFALKAQQFGKGIRILRQNSWETLVSFIISQRNNIPKIKSTIERLCRAFGEEIRLQLPDGTIIIDWSFPRPERIAGLELYELDGIGLGYRDEYIHLASQAVCHSQIDLAGLRDPSVSGEEAVIELMTLKGVGPKVANCIALFGLHKLDMFPIDIWMQRIIDTKYGGNLDHTVYGVYSGLMQQYMFYYIKNGG